MLRFKFLGVVLFYSFFANAQNYSNEKEKISFLIEVKFALEKAIDELDIKGIKTDTSIISQVYRQTIEELKTDIFRNSIHKLINSVDTEKEYLETMLSYNYQSPFSSNVDFGSIIIIQDFLKIVAYCIYEKNLDYLLPLNEIPFLKNENNSISQEQNKNKTLDSIIQKILDTKLAYEKSLYEIVTYKIKSDTLVKRNAYFESIQNAKKTEILGRIEYHLEQAKYNTERYHKRYLDYYYRRPLIASLGVKNYISWQDYYLILKLVLFEQNLNILPPLSEISFIK